MLLWTLWIYFLLLHQVQALNNGTSIIELQIFLLVPCVYSFSFSHPEYWMKSARAENQNSMERGEHGERGI